MNTLTVTHRAADGTLIDGTTKHDGTAPILRSHGWKYSPTCGWYIPRSRDTLPNRTTIAATAEALRTAGHRVDLDLDARTRPAAEVEADRTQRMQLRTQRLTARAARLDAAADAAHARADVAHAKLPPAGEPIHIGHHSENRHRRAIDNAHTTYSQALAADADASAAHAAAETASHAHGAHISPTTVGNRINRLEAELRGIQRRLNGYTETTSGIVVSPAQGDRRKQLLADLAEHSDQLTYWNQAPTGSTRVRIRPPLQQSRSERRRLRPDRRLLVPRRPRQSKDRHRPNSSRLDTHDALAQSARSQADPGATTCNA
ncbi:DUF3560 domain-containing protein [Microbacteriaceae bacterium VKM Ac-2854]|nr:DUF3560 domain-containing protein [Microbacteriaceae bacterium VKM Ac-2854]